MSYLYSKLPGTGVPHHIGTGGLRWPQSRLRDTAQISQGKIDRLRRTPAEFTTPAFDDYGLRD
jgi:hypothetical protein